jgi:Skp family chaperone for outer membrane proteins
MKYMLNMAVVAALAGAMSSSSWAQTARPGPAAGNQQLMQLQQLASERTELQAENAKLKTELAKAKKDLEAVRRQARSVDTAKVDQRAKAESEAALARSQVDLERTQADLVRQKEREQELVGRFRETATMLRDVETERTTAKQSLAQHEQELKVCVDRNQALYRLNSEILTRFEKQGFWSDVTRREPFTQLKRVELENLIDGFRGSAQDQVVQPFQTSPVR